jgi:hypothetical protein
MDKINLYSPTQVLVASFVGGPLAAVYVLWKNFDDLANASAAKQTIIWGMLFVVALLTLIPFLPDKFPNYAIPATYAFGARMVAEKYQMSKKAIMESDRYGFHSAWNVVGVSVGFLIALLVIGVAVVLALDHFGIIKL